MIYYAPLMRIVFMGSSQASAMCLKAILRLPGLEVVGVVTQPDRPAGRGKVLTPCRCRAYAEERGIKSCITPENVNDPEALAQIRAWKPDVIVVVAFGQFLKEELLNLPPLGCVNCHFSLLPKYRGASPVTAALLAGDAMAVRTFTVLRLPRAVMALIGGFGLGAAGFVYQTVFRNPLASPDIIGVSSGASVGAAAASPSERNTAARPPAK